MATRRFLAMKLVQSRLGYSFPEGSVIDPSQLAADEVDSLIARRLIELAPEQFRMGTIEALDGPGAPACTPTPFRVR